MKGFTVFPFYACDVPIIIVLYSEYRNAYDRINSKQYRAFAMLRTKHPRVVETLIGAIIVGAVALSIVIAYNWQSIFPSSAPSKYPIALSNILFSMPNWNSSEANWNSSEIARAGLQIESVSVGIQTGNASEPIITNWITLNTTGLEPLASPAISTTGSKYAVSDYITPTTYSIGQTVVIDRVSNITQIHQQLTITITSKVLQYTAGEYVNMQATRTRTGYAIAIPTNATWTSIP